LKTTDTIETTSSSKAVANNLTINKSTLRKNSIVQTQLKVGQPNDKYEQEADRVAGQVMSMPDSSIHLQPIGDEEEEPIQAKPLAESITPLIQRQADEEEELIQSKPILQQQPAEEEEEIMPKLQLQEEEEELLQPKSDSREIGLVPELESEINNLNGKGQALPEETRAFFEPRFGQDFSQVKTHTDSSANKLARSIHARAFTKGNNIVFGRGEFSPGNTNGKTLLAHELTHVVQQNGPVRRKPISRKANTIRKTNVRSGLQINEGNKKTIQRVPVNAGTLITMLEDYGRREVLGGLVSADRRAINDFLNELSHRSNQMADFWSMISGGGGAAAISGVAGSAEATGIAGLGPWAILGGLFASAGIWYASTWTKEGLRNSISTARRRLLSQADEHGRQYQSSVLFQANDFGNRIMRGEERGLTADTRQYIQIREAFRRQALQAPSENNTYDLKWNLLTNRWNPHLRRSTLWRDYRSSAILLIMQTRRVRP
jgi:hypothetical protein